MARYSIQSGPGKLVVIFRRGGIGLRHFVVAAALSVFFAECALHWTPAPFIFSVGARSDYPAMYALMAIIALAIVGVFLWELPWSMCGKEEIALTSNMLTCSYSFCGLKRKRTYAISEMSVPYFHARTPGSPAAGAIAFFAGDSRVLFFHAITRTEANGIVDAIVQEFPQQNSIWGSYANNVSAASDANSFGGTDRLTLFPK